MSGAGKIPVTLFTGFFGVGKTTAIKSLLARKPASEKWAVLVNEFGEVAIDQMAVDPDDHSDVVIRDIPGGCMCCAMNVPMRVAVTDILRRVQPDRLLIEPTGIGHPAGILDELRAPGIARAIALKAVICLVDPRHVTDPRIQAVDVFRDQVHLADILVAGKSDLADPGDLVAFRDWAHTLYPAKYRVLEARQGDLNLDLLDINPQKIRVPLFPDAHDHDHDEGPLAISAPDFSVAPGRPYRAENVGSGYRGCGWIFSREDIFDRKGVTDLLRLPGLPGLSKGAVVERLKGVFRTGKDWVLIDRARNEVTVTPIAYRNDSRLEIIVPKGAPVDWEELENALIRVSGSSSPSS